jgi:hypothetical protein
LRSSTYQLSGVRIRKSRGPAGAPSSGGSLWVDASPRVASKLVMVKRDYPSIHAAVARSTREPVTYDGVALVELTGSPEESVAGLAGAVAVVDAPLPSVNRP